MTKVKVGILIGILGLLAIRHGADLQAATFQCAPNDIVYCTGTNELDMPSLKQNGVQVTGGAPPIISVRAVQSLAVGTTIQHAGLTSLIELVQIQSTGGALTSTANPRIAAGVDGQLIVVMGQSTTNTYTLGDGSGVKLAFGVASVTFDDRTNVMFRYDTALSTWRMIGSVGGGGGGGGGTAASILFTPTGGITETNVQTGMAGIDTRMEKLANKNTSNGYMGLDSNGRAAWNRLESYVVHADLSVNSQIDASTQAVTTIGIQNSGAGNLNLNGTGNPRITGCTAGNDAAELTLVGLSATKTVTIPTGNGIMLAGNTGSVIVGIPPGGGSVRFKCRGSTTTWEQMAAPPLQTSFNAGNSILTGSTAATGVRWGDVPGGNYCSMYWDAANSNRPTIQCFCGGAACDNVVQLGAGKQFQVKNVGFTNLFTVDEATGVVSTGTATPKSPVMGNTLAAPTTCSSGGTTAFFAPMGRTGGTDQATWSEAQVHQPWPHAGKAAALRVLLRVAVPSGQSIAVTVRKNGANTALTCTIAASASTCNLTLSSPNEISYAAGDVWALQTVCSGGSTNIEEIQWGITVQ